ncbi:MAG: hypothetical protein ACLPWD_07100 [Methanobacterium sp.]
MTKKKNLVKAEKRGVTYECDSNSISRKELGDNGEVRDTFIGTFERMGSKNGWFNQRTVLLKDIKNNEGKIITDHLWFNLTKGFQKLHLREGDIIQFDARVKAYVKGYNKIDKKIDYKLSYPTKLKKL